MRLRVAALLLAAISMTSQVAAEGTRRFVVERVCEVECRDAGPWADATFLGQLAGTLIRERIAQPDERPGVLLLDDRERVLVDSRRVPSALPMETLTNAVASSDEYFSALARLERLSAEERPERRDARQALGELERLLGLWDASRRTLLPLVEGEESSLLSEDRRAWVETLVALDELDLGESRKAAQRLARLVRTNPGLPFREAQLRALVVAYRRSGLPGRAAQALSRLREEFPGTAPLEDER